MKCSAEHVAHGSSFAAARRLVGDRFTGETLSTIGRRDDVPVASH